MRDGEDAPINVQLSIFQLSRFDAEAPDVAGDDRNGAVTSFYRQARQSGDSDDGNGSLHGGRILVIDNPPSGDDQAQYAPTMKRTSLCWYRAS